MLSLNWVDYLILALLMYYVYEGYSNGFVRALLDLINFIFSFLIGLRFYGLIAGILMAKFSIPQGFSNALGFFVVALVPQVIFGILIRSFTSYNLGSSSVNSYGEDEQNWVALRNLNKLLGILPGVLSGIIIATFILILFVALPIAASAKRAVSSSEIGNFLLTNSQAWEKQLKNVFGGAINETVNFLTVAPKDNEIIALNYKTKAVLSDPNSEQDMFRLVNKERAFRGIKKLIFDNELRDVGREHCQDMFARGYFSHYTPDGFSPFDRMEKAEILYDFAGENLALSPNTDIAMQGLMNSPGHKANILSTNFGRIGIGVIDGGIYGEMFCQEFTD